MPERSLFRIGSVSAMIGAVLAVVVNLLHPRAATLQNPEAFLRMIAESSGALWLGDHIGIIVADLLVTAGLIALARSVTREPGAAWARLGYAGALVSAALLLLLMAADGIAIKRIADGWISAGPPDKAAAFQAGRALAEVNLAILTVWIIVFWGATIIVYGLAIVTSDVYPRWLGWAALLAGLGSTADGLALAVTGPSVLLGSILFPVFSILITVWIFVMGLLLWRKARSAA